MKHLCFFILFLVYSLAPGAEATHFCKHRELKYSRHFSRRDYANQSQNWCILQDKRGVIYAANQGGVLEFDGVSWRYIPVPNRSVRSLTLADSRKILIEVRSEGFTLYDGRKAHPFPTDADEYVKENLLSCGVRLSSGDFALTTLRGGLVIIDASGG